jgi:hypothetical protein
MARSTVIYSPKVPNISRGNSRGANTAAAAINEPGMNTASTIAAPAATAPRVVTRRHHFGPERKTFTERHTWSQAPDHSGYAGLEHRRRFGDDGPDRWLSVGIGWPHSLGIRTGGRLASPKVSGKWGMHCREGLHGLHCDGVRPIGVPLPELTPSRTPRSSCKDTESRSAHPDCRRPIARPLHRGGGVDWPPARKPIRQLFHRRNSDVAWRRIEGTGDGRQKLRAAVG